MVAWVPFFQHFAPAEGPGNRLDHGVVDLSVERRPCLGRTIGCEDEFPATAIILNTLLTR
jgi:hypothetical protein